MVIALLCARGASAGERPVVAGADVYVRGGRVVSDVRCGGLFSEQIVGTVQSGLPAVVEVLYSVSERGGGAVRSGVHSYELRYDVWEDVYAIAGDDSTRTFSSFESMGRAVERLRAVPIVPVGALDAARWYRLELTVAVHPLRGAERERIEGFVEESVGARSHGTWREQVLNINELIGRFFSRDKGTSNRSDVFQSAFFTPASLAPAPREP